MEENGNHPDPPPTDKARNDDPLLLKAANILSNEISENAPIEQDKPEDTDSWLSILPDEILEPILKNHLWHPTHLFNCSLAHSSLRRILDPSKNAWLFDQVLPFIYPHLHPTKQWVVCRKVCRLWKYSVDQYIQNYSQQNLIRYPPSVPTLSYQQLLNNHQYFFHNFVSSDTGSLYYFSESFQIHQFLQIYQNFIGNPFITRHIKFYFSLDENSEVYWRSVLDLLAKFGEFIWHVHFGISCDFMGIFAPIQILQGCLHKLSNLQSLSIGLYSWYARYPPPNVIARLQRRFKPLPVLPHLKIVKVTRSTTKLPLINQLVGFPSLYLDQLEQLMLDDEVHFLEDLVSPTASVAFPSIVHLKIGIKSEAGLEILKIINGPMREFCLGVNQDRIGLLKIFQSVGHLGSTLTSLDINYNETCYRNQDNIPEATSSEITETETLDFPNLKILGIQEYHGEPLNDLLTISGSLPPFYLEIVAHSAPDQFGSGYFTKLIPPEKDQLQIHGYCQKDMYKSCIWEKVPTLQKLGFAGTNRRPDYERVDVVYTRDKYLIHQATH